MGREKQMNGSFYKRKNTATSLNSAIDGMHNDHAFKNQVKQNL